MPLLDPNWDDAAYVRDAVPDGTIVRPGTTVEQTWWLRNTGSSTWAEGYALVRVGGKWPGAPGRVLLPPLPPEGEAPVMVQFPVPPTPGALRSEWRAFNAQGHPFGDLLWVAVEAAGSADEARSAADFVTCQGRELVVGGRPLRFFGMNLRGLAHYGRRTSDPLRFSQLDHRRSQLRHVYDLGGRMVRLFLADKDASSEEVVTRLAELLAIGREFPGLYFLPTFTNLYNDAPFYPCGDERFFAPRGGRDLLTKEFFAGGYRENYLPLVQRVVTRFSEEPQILAWEIGNELKLDRADPNDAHDINPQIFVNFMHEIAREIKRLDPNHLVTTGMKSTQHAWMEGSALRDRLYSSPNIDFLTIHSYEGMFDQDVDKKVYDDIGLATRLEKPFVVEEAGFDVRVFPGQRVEKYRRHMETWHNAGASGYMPWGFIHAHEIGDGDNEVGVGVNLADYHDLLALFRSQGQSPRDDGQTAKRELVEDREIGAAPQEPDVLVSAPQPLTRVARRRGRAAEKIGIDANAPINPVTGQIHPQVENPAIIADSGAGWVRINFILGRPWQDPTDQARPHGSTWQETYRRLLDGYHQRGMKIYGLISDEAMREPVEGRFRQPPGPDALADPWLRRYTETFVTIARMFADRLQLVESFNEPDDWKANLPGHTAATPNWIHPGWYAVILESVYTAVRAVPELAHLTVISGPLQGLQGGGRGNGAAEYLRRAYEHGVNVLGWGKNGTPFPFDGVGYHLYVHEELTSDTAKQQAQIRATYRRYIDEMQAQIRLREGRSKLLFVSEAGWLTNGSNREAMEQFQAESLPFALRCLAEDDDVGLVVNFSTQDFGGPGDGKFYGIYRAGALDEGGRKLVYREFQKLCQTELALPVLAAGLGDDAVFVRDSDLVKDRTMMAPGQRFTQRWQVRNNGSTPWGEGYRLAAIDQSMGAPPSVPLLPTAPGQVATITLEHLAPVTPGVRRSTWQFFNPENQPFGQKLWTEIVVTAEPVTRNRSPIEPLPPELPGVAADPITAAALGMIYTNYWLQVLRLPSGPEAEAAIERITADTVARILVLRKGDSLSR